MLFCYAIILNWFCEWHRDGYYRWYQTYPANKKGPKTQNMINVSITKNDTRYKYNRNHQN